MSIVCNASTVKAGRSHKSNGMELQNQIGNKKKQKAKKDFRSNKDYYIIGEGFSRSGRNLTLFGFQNSAYGEFITYRGATSPGMYPTMFHLLNFKVA